MTALDSMNVGELVASLGLEPDPHAGWSRDTVDASGDLRTAIHLLGVGDCLEWHRVVGASEAWHHLAGGPLALTLSPNGHDASAHRLGRALAMGDALYLAVPADHWRTAEPLGEWTLIARTIAPATGERETAPPGWRPMPREAM